eukprot:CAMPEP_0179856738 /NCGR_PEP_ID=MMETSP0982-20121206/11340_1 /TAXON_ID=483367 /ORGANISM="non described non described, Strain CCMP 2436" /LENGTH=48 /DNA_ID= /DNA_START= /DNA_END= /DNA_ORIENTATION=
MRMLNEDANNNSNIKPNKKNKNTALTINSSKSGALLPPQGDAKAQQSD